MLKNTETVVNVVKYNVKARGTWQKFVTENNITRDMIADTAREVAGLCYPNDEQVQKVDGKRTRFGNAVQAAGYGMRSVLAKAETTETDYLARAIKAAVAAHDKGEVSNEIIVKAITDALAN